MAGAAWRERGFDKAKPSSLRARGKLASYPFASEARCTDEYVAEVRRGLRGCKMFLFLPFYFVAWIQIWNNLISQAGQMALHGTPNDLLQNLDPIALIVFIPLLDRKLPPPTISMIPIANPFFSRQTVVVYPMFRKCGIDFDPTTRIFCGFLLASVSMAYASVLQHYIYTSAPQSIHVWVQAPAYVLVALSEAFVIVTGLELAYTQAPTNLRSVVSSLFWLTIGVAAAISISLSPVSQDPHLVWMYGSLAIVSFVAGCVFYACFFRNRKASGQEEMVVEGEEPRN